MSVHSPLGNCNDCGEALLIVDQGQRWLCRNGCNPLGVGPE